MSVKVLANAGISKLFDDRQEVLRKENQVISTSHWKGSLFELKISVD